MQTKVTTIGLAVLVLAAILLVLGVVTEREAATAARQATAAAEWIEATRNEISMNGSGDPDRRRRNAAKALEMAAAAERAGDHVLSRLLMLNAVNQEPADPKYLSAYTESMLKSEHVTPTELDRARNVIELATYQVPPEQIEPTLKLVNRLSEKYQKSLAGHPTTQASSSDGAIDRTMYATKLAGLKAVGPAIWSDDQKLAGQIESLRSLANLLEDEEPDADVVGMGALVQAELSHWTSIARIKAQCNYVDACLQKLDQDPANIASDMSVSVLQAAENALPQFWGEDLSSAPVPLVEKIKAYPKRIVDWSAKVATARSKPVVDEITSTCTVALATASRSSKHEDASRILEQRLKDANTLYAKITSSESRIEAEQSIEKMANELRDRRKAQCTAYQKWALGRCEIAFKHWQDLKVYTSGKNAKDIYENDQLYQIDAALLSPDVGRLHSDVLNRLFPNMDPPVQVEMWRKTQQEKWGLDRF